MNLFTSTEIGENSVKIHHKERILTFGSCFAENIGQRLVENKFIALCNPFGIVYNPVSISSSLHRLHKNSNIDTKELQLCQDYYCHPQFHSQYNGIDKDATLLSINNAISSVSTFVNDGLDWLILSLGTSFVYRQKSTNEIVNNCHKFPAADFDRQLLDINSITNALTESILLLRSTNPNLKVILTVSPIRHLKDGLSANLRSKARLIEASHQIAEQTPNCFYFPSYEIMIEELRDYRWYKEDLIHPNNQAIEHIWNNFKKFGLHRDSQILVDKMDTIHKNLNHKPFLAASEQYQKFLSSTKTKIEAMENEYPHLDFNTDRHKLEALLNLA